MAWRSLDSYTSVNSKLPTLLISTTFRPTSYAIHLTDLTHIWSESLERRDIYRRSQKESTSIDPTDGDQIHVLLDKIRLGVEGGNCSSLSLTINQDAETPGITLSITVDLPGGLSPLEWPVNLTPAPQSLLTAQLVIPLLEAQQMRMREMASLADSLREKDQVIQKLVDKLESQGTELGQVYPHIAGKSGRKIDRKYAEERVKGLKPFDMQVWRHGLEKNEPQNIEQLASQIFRCDGGSDLNIKDPSHILKNQDNWWVSLKGDTFGLPSNTPTLHERSRARKDQGAVKNLPKEEESIEDDDHFQVQATPPRHIQNEQKPEAEQPVDDESTEDDDDYLDALSQKSKIPDSLPTSQQGAKSLVRVPKKLGVIGGKKEPPKPIPEDDDETTEGSTPSPIQKSHKRQDRAISAQAEPTVDKPKRTLGRVGGKNASPQPQAEQPVKEQMKPSRGRLGQVGGKKKEPTPCPLEPEPKPEAAVTPPKPAVETKKKLGSLGGSKAKSSEEAKVRHSEEPRGRVAKQEEKEPPLRETSEERANKKREQLKIDLEERTKAPAKKKRKF